MKNIEQLKSNYPLNYEIFSVYDYSEESIQEVLCKFFTKINECVDQSNDMYELADWLVNEGLSIEVTKKLDMWLADGTLGNLINKVLLKEINDKINLVDNKVTTVDNKVTILENTRYAVYVRDRLTSETSDSIALQEAFTQCKEGGVVYINRPLELMTSVRTDKSLTLQGRNMKLTTVKNGLNDILDFRGSYVYINDLRCDNNLKGRTFITISNSTQCIVKGCSFTGYSKEYGYYQTDSAIRVDGDVSQIVIQNCQFIDNGYQYGEALGELNRCISFNHNTIKNATVKDCIFTRYNQGIVAINDTLTVENCIFDSGKDNSVYTNCNVLNVVNNIFRNHIDEPIVFSKSVTLIQGNTFENFGNKAIATNSDLDSVKVVNNTFINNYDSGQVISFRTLANVVKSFVFDGNTVICKTVYSNNYPVITFCNTKLLTITNNYISTASAGGPVIQCWSEYVIVDGNHLENTIAITALVNRLTTGNTKITANNKTLRQRLPIERNMIGIESDIEGAYTFNSSSNIMFCEGKPTKGDNFKRGDIIFNIGTGAMSGWRCTSDGILTEFTL